MPLAAQPARVRAAPGAGPGRPAGGCGHRGWREELCGTPGPPSERLGSRCAGIAGLAGSRDPVLGLGEGRRPVGAAGGGLGGGLGWGVCVCTGIYIAMCI